MILLVQKCAFGTKAYGAWSEWTVKNNKISAILLRLNLWESFGTSWRSRVGLCNVSPDVFNSTVIAKIRFKSKAMFYLCLMSLYITLINLIYRHFLLQ